MRNKVLLSFLVSLTSLMSSAQQDILIGSLPHVSQAIYVNPAIGGQPGIHVGLPFMSSVSVQHRNNFLNPAALFKNTEDRLEFQTEEYLSRVEGDNIFGADMTVDIFSFGIPIRGQYFSFSVRDRVSIDIRLPEDLLKFPVLGNAQFDLNGGTLNLGDMRLSLDHYTEYAAGWQGAVGERLVLGARAKLLFGKENLTTQNSDFSWHTDPEDYTWSFSGDFAIQSSGLTNQFDSIDGNSLLENGKVAKYVFSSANAGLGLDIGAHYQLNSKWDLGLSLVDIGYVRYKNNIKNYSGVGQDIAFVGVEITEAFVTEGAAFGDSLDAAIAELSTSLAESFALNENTESYSVGLRTKAYASAGYMLFKKAKTSGKAGLLLYADVRDGSINAPTAAISYTQTIVDRVTLAASYSVVDKDAKNLGLAFSVKGGPVIFYTSIDNILWTNMSRIRFPEATESISYPSFAQNATLHFGMNLLLNKSNKTDKAQGRLDSSSTL